MNSTSREHSANSRRFEGKVAFITGGGRGQGRSHAVALAKEGADIVLLDLCEDIASAPYPLSRQEDLDQTVTLIREAGGRVVAHVGDVRSGSDTDKAVELGMSEFGRVDIVVANAGIQSFGSCWEITEEQWRDVIDVNLTGVWNTIRSAVPHMIAGGRGGSIISISSFAGLHAIPNLGHYTAAKHGVTGLAQAFAVELAQFNIRSNSIHPATVNSPMIDNEPFIEFFMGTTGGSLADIEPAMQTLLALPVPWIEIADMTDMVLFLASDAASKVTGAVMPVDAGGRFPFKIPTA